MPSSPESSSVHRVGFGPFVLDEGGTQLLRDGEPVAIGPLALRLLGYLIAHRARVVSGDELLATNWDGVVVAPGALRFAIFELRRALGDTGSEQRYVATVRSRGYRFIGKLETRADTSHSGSVASSSPLQGRDEERNALVAMLHGTATQGCACILVGPPGVGKTRLAQELVRFAKAEGVSVAEAYADPEGSGPPLGPWLRLLRTCLDTASSEDQARCRRIAPDAVALVLGEETTGWPSKHEEPPEVRNQILDECACLLTTLGSERRLVLLLDDLQWADELSLALLATVARTLGESRILLLATCRKIAAREHRALASTIQSALRDPRNVRLELPNLSLASITEIARDLTGAQLAPHTLREVHNLTQGNPLFSVELLKLLKRAPGSTPNDLLCGDAGQLAAVIARRLQLVPEPVRLHLSRASVLRVEFTLPELSAVLELPPAAVYSFLDEALDCGVLMQVSATRYSFHHTLLREAAYRELSGEQRSRTHALYAEWLERDGTPSPARIAELAHHYHRAASPELADKALRYASLAARDAAETGAHMSAVSYYDQALECVSSVHGYQPSDRAALEIERAVAMRHAGMLMEADAQLVALADRAARHGWHELLARAALGYSGQTRLAFSPGQVLGPRDQRELQLLEQALLATPTCASETRVLLLCSLAWALTKTDRRQQCKLLCDEAVALARQLDEPWLLARALLARVYGFSAPNEHAERLSTCNELIRVVESRSAAELEVDARITRVMCLLEACEPEAARLDEARATLLANANGSRRLRSRAEMPAILRAFFRGDLAAIESLSNQAISQAPNDVLARTIFVARMASMNGMRDGLEGATAVLEGMLAAYPSELGLRCALASRYAASEQPEAAREQYDLVAVDDFAYLPQDISWLAAMTYLAEVAVGLDDPKRAHAVEQKLVPFSSRWVFYGGEAVPGGPVALFLAQLAATRRDGARSEAWGRQARAMCERMQAPLSLQFCNLAEAYRIFLCGPERDRSYADQLVQSAIAFADDKGLRALRTEAELVRRRGTALGIRKMSSVRRVLP